MVHPCAHAQVLSFWSAGLHPAEGEFWLSGHVEHWLLVMVVPPTTNVGAQPVMVLHCFTQACWFFAASAIKHPATHEGSWLPLTGCPCLSTSVHGKPAALHALLQAVTGSDALCPPKRTSPHDDGGGMSGTKGFGYVMLGMGVPAGFSFVSGGQSIAARSVEEEKFFRAAVSICDQLLLHWYF